MSTYRPLVAIMQATGDEIRYCYGSGGKCSWVHSRNLGTVVAAGGRRLDALGIEAAYYDLDLPPSLPPVPTKKPAAPATLTPIAGASAPSRGRFRAGRIASDDEKPVQPTMWARPLHRWKGQILCRLDTRRESVMIRSDAIAIVSPNGRYDGSCAAGSRSCLVATGLPWTKSPGNWTRRPLPMRACPR